MLASTDVVYGFPAQGVWGLNRKAIASILMSSKILAKRRGAMAETTVNRLPWLRKRIERADPNFLRDLVKVVVDALMGAEADGVRGVWLDRCRIWPRNWMRASMSSGNRKLEAGPCLYVWLDATTQRSREGGRVINVATVAATGVNREGKREILGMDVITSENGAGWTAFLRGLVARGLTGVSLVISDAHAAPLAVAAIVSRHEEGRAIKTSRRLCGANPKGSALTARPLMPPRRKDDEKMDAMNPYTTLTDVTEKARPGCPVLAVEPRIDTLPSSLVLSNIKLMDLETALSTANIVCVLVKHKEFKENVSKISLPADIIDAVGLNNRDAI
jgi:hypothetical protein